MIRKLFTIALVLSLTLGLFSCGGKEYMGSYDYNLDEYITLGEYTNLKYTMDEIVVTDEDVLALIDTRLAAAKGSEGYKLQLTDENVIDGDILNIDFEGKLDGVAFEGGAAEGFELTIGSGQFIPGFEEGLVGKAIGETVDLEMTFPADYPAENLAGMDVVFTVTINSGIRPTTPLYDIDFVKSTTEYTTIDEYEAAIKEELRISKEDSALAQMQNTLWNQVVENAEIKGYPEGLVDAKIEENINYYTSYAQQNGMEFLDFIQVYFGMNEEDFNTYMESYSKAIIDQELVMFAVAKAENIGITEKEYKDLIDLTLKEQGFESLEAFDKAAGVSFEEYAGKENLQKTFLLEKVINFIVEAADK